MTEVEIRIPQLGEGLQEARLLRFLKQPGESVSQDEPIYEMETDKAVVEIESPTAGVLSAWDAKEDDVLPIGAVIGRISSDGPDGATAVTTEPQTVGREPERVATSAAPVTSLGIRTGQVPPRTRAYAAQMGLSDDELSRLAEHSGGKLMPESIDKYLAERTDKSAVMPETTGKPGTFRDVTLGQKQRTLVYRLQRGTQDIVPATMQVQVDWAPVEAVREALREKSSPSQFLLFAWCVAQASRNHPRFRSSILNDSTIREYDHLNLGIAVARPDDELLLARIDAADTLGFEQFMSAARAAIEKARQGTDQAAESMQLSLTNMASAGVRMGIPVFAAPAVGTIFVGETYDEARPLPGGGIGFRRVANMVLSFDHRIANGIGAAHFLAEIRTRIENLRAELGI